MTGKDLLEKRLTLALSQREMANRMKVSLATYTRMEQHKDKPVLARYEPSIQLIESQRLKEHSKAELKNMSALMRSSYEARLKTRNATIEEKTNKTNAPKKKKNAGKSKT